MKNKLYFLFLMSLMSSIAWAQPVFQNANNWPTVGTVNPVAVAAASFGTGPTGANVTWDFTALSVSQVGTATEENPANTPYFSTFPTADYCTKLLPTGSTTGFYVYYNSRPGAIESLTDNWPNSNKNYSPNPKTRIPFPFSFGNSITDTFQVVGNSPWTVILSYDAWGTLKLNSGTYNNVARIRYDFGPGDYTLCWFTMNPLQILCSYDASNNQLTFIGNGSTDITERKKESKFFIYPNPGGEKVFISNGSDKEAGTIYISDLKGNVIYTSALDKKGVEVNTGAWSRGIYLCTFSRNGIQEGIEQLILQ